MPEKEQNAYEKINYLFTAIFTIEVILKLIGQSPKKFIADRFNIFDTVIVLISISELFISSGSGGVTALRAFRLFRILKLFRHGNLRVLLDSIAYTMSTIGNYVILLGLFIYVYSLLGMQFFAGKMTYDDDGYYDPHGKRARANFDTLYWAAIAVFQVLIGDNWNDVMFNCVKSVGVGARFYFISLILFGNIVMLNLFLAILLGNFDKARSYWIKKSIFEMFETAADKKMSLSKAINIILGEVSKSVKEELLVHEPQDIFRINGKLIIINKKLFDNDPENEEKLLYYERHAVYEINYEPIVDHPENDQIGDEDRDNDPDSDRDKNNSPDDSKKISKHSPTHLKKALIKDQYDEDNKHEVFKKVNFDQESPENENISPFNYQQIRYRNTLDDQELEEYFKTNKLIISTFSSSSNDEQSDKLNDTIKKNSRIMRSASFDMIRPKLLEEITAMSETYGKKVIQEIDDLEKQMEHEYFGDEVEYKKPHRICHSSLLIFHRDWRFRKYLIALVVTPESHQEYLAQKKEENHSFLNNSINDPNIASNKVVEELDETKNEMFSGNYERYPQHANKAFMMSSKKKSEKITDEKIYNILKFKDKSTHPSKYFNYIVITLIM